MTDQSPYDVPANPRRAVALMFGVYLAGTTLLWLLMPERYLPEISLLTMLQFWAIISLVGLGGLAALWAGGALIRRLTDPLKAKNSEKLKREPVGQLHRLSGERLDIVEDAGKPFDQQKEKRS
jgi:hypothetical protein